MKKQLLEQLHQWLQHCRRVNPLPLWRPPVALPLHDLGVLLLLLVQQPLQR